MTDRRSEFHPIVPLTASCLRVRQWNGRFGAHSGPSQGDSRRRAIRPTETSTTAVCYVRNTSTAAIRRRDQTPSELAAFAEAERDRIRERIGQVKADQKARGRYLGGRSPSGSGVAMTASSSRTRPSKTLSAK
jgi:hypothetical protein